MKLLTKVFALVLVCVIALPLSALAAKPVAPGTPTLLSPTSGWSTTEVKPLIKGLTQNNTQVAVYIDGVYNGQAQVVNGPEGTASFAYRPFLDLKPGLHIVKVKAQDARTNLESLPTRNYEFLVEEPNPAPILIRTVVNQQTSWSRPFITGLAKNDTTIEVYIDGVYNGQIKVKDHPSGTTDFAYRPFLDLKPGLHKVYVLAKDYKGKKSKISATLTFEVKKPNPTTAKQTKKERVSAIEENKEEILESASPSPSSFEGEAKKELKEENEEAVNKDSKKEKDEPEKEKRTAENKSTSTLGWALLVLIAAGLVYRNRKSVKTFFSENSENKDQGDSNDSSDPSSGNVEVITKSSQNKDKPDPPPAASDY